MEEKADSILSGYKKENSAVDVRTDLDSHELKALDDIINRAKQAEDEGEYIESKHLYEQYLNTIEVFNIRDIEIVNIGTKNDIIQEDDIEKIRESLEWIKKIKTQLAIYGYYLNFTPTTYYNLSSRTTLFTCRVSNNNNCIIDFFLDSMKEWKKYMLKFNEQGDLIGKTETVCLVNAKKHDDEPWTKIDPPIFTVMSIIELEQMLEKNILENNSK